MYHLVGNSSLRRRRLHTPQLQSHQIFLREALVLCEQGQEKSVYTLGHIKGALQLLIHLYG